MLQYIKIFWQNNHYLLDLVAQFRKKLQTLLIICLLFMYTSENGGSIKLKLSAPTLLT